MRRLLIPILSALVLAAPAGAGTIIVKLSFVTGSLGAVTAPASATAAGPVQVPVTIADGRGSGKGWTLHVVASHNVTVTRITARCAANSTCKLPIETTTPSGNVVLQADHDSGMGVMNLVITVAPLKAGTPTTPLSFTVS